jgi:hypothetical protein
MTCMAGAGDAGASTGSGVLSAVLKLTSKGGLPEVGVDRRGSYVRARLWVGHHQGIRAAAIFTAQGLWIMLGDPSVPRNPQAHLTDSLAGRSGNVPI